MIAASDPVLFEDPDTNANFCQEFKEDGQACCKEVGFMKMPVRYDFYKNQLVCDPENLRIYNVKGNIEKGGRTPKDYLAQKSINWEKVTDDLLPGCERKVRLWMHNQEMFRVNQCMKSLAIGQDPFGHYLVQSKSGQQGRALQMISTKLLPNICPLSGGSAEMLVYAAILKLNNYLVAYPKVDICCQT